MGTIQTYYRLTKPGIVRSNALMAAAGFLLAASQPGGQYDWLAFGGLVAGLALVIAAACVVNNYLDRGIDAAMERTKQRALPSGAVSGQQALLYAAVLGIGGVVSLALTTNWRTTVTAAIAFVAYVAVYGWAKRHTVHGTLVGTISGALPPVIGYVGSSNHFDTACLLLYVILTAWQLPHFYAIAIYRSADYAKAKIPVLPLVHGVAAARRQIMGWVIVLALTAPLLSVFGYTGWVYAVAAGAICVWWLVSGWRSFGRQDETAWAKAMFLRSLAVNIVLCIGFAAGGLLP